MRRVQSVAVDLMEAKGFDKVTVEEVAEAADVSPSTIYRYFSTKEGLVLHDEHDDVVLQAAPFLFGQHDVLAAFEAGFALIGPMHFDDDGLSLRRVALWFSTPSIQAEGYLWCDEFADHIARAAHESGRNEAGLDELRIQVGAVMGAFMMTLRIWHEQGGSGDLVQMLLDSVRTMRAMGKS